MAESVLFSAISGVATITLNRPAVLNALDESLLEGLEATFDRIAGDPSCRVVILAGAGPGFMAGGDIKMFTGLTAMAPAERRARFERFIHRVHPLILAMRRLPLPIVARVHGPCAGFGMSLMMACDLAVAAEDSVFTLAYTLIGTSPDGGSTWFLPRHVGAKKAMEIALLGDRFDAATALRLGLVNRVVPAAELEATTAALAAQLAQGPRAAYAATKRLLQASSTASLPEQLVAEAEAFAGCAATEDFAEGVAAFVGKRPPRFG
jgi:2-(1,2-epoxy-1,2-dihydrophenyl)acetyl-CoA isomerase